MRFQHLYFEINLVFRVAASACFGALLSVSVQAADLDLDPNPDAAARAMIAKYVATNFLQRWMESV